MYVCIIYVFMKVCECLKDKRGWILDVSMVVVFYASDTSGWMVYIEYLEEYQSCQSNAPLCLCME